MPTSDSSILFGVTRGQTIEFKLALRKAIAKNLEQEWLTTFITAIRNDSSIEEAIQEGIEE